jgi:hypothetical protein
MKLTMDDTTGTGYLPIYDVRMRKWPIVVDDKDRIVCKKPKPREGCPRGTVCAFLGEITPRRLRAIADAMVKAKKRGHGEGIIAIRDVLIGFASR